MLTASLANVAKKKKKKKKRNNKKIEGGHNSIIMNEVAVIVFELYALEVNIKGVSTRLYCC